MEKFYIGLDIGTNSVGIAATDENYNLLRAKGKDLWAVRLFDEAQPAKDRRMKRAARRRYMRRRQRIELLQELLAPLMAGKDPTFFMRLNNSPYHLEDKDARIDSKYVLFADSDYNDADFHGEYPTIYHLRRALIRGEAKKDIRFYYLAFHHILKYRGNFLFEGQELSAIRDLSRLFTQLNDRLTELDGDDAWTFDTDKIDEFKEKAITDASVNARISECEKLFGKLTSEVKSMIKLMLGSNASPSKIFDRKELKELKPLQFKALEDSEFEALSQDFTDEEFNVLVALRAIYNYITFERVLGGYEYISDALTAMYEKHEKDLKKLKDLLRGHGSLYNQMFRRAIGGGSKNAIANYVSYVGFTKVNGKKTSCKRCVNADEFRKHVKKLLETYRAELGNETVINEIIADIEKDTFMPRILNADNGTFPYQVNDAELNAILGIAERDFPEFAEVQDGYSLSDKIRSLLKFRIPYYVGPLNTYHEDKGGNSWMVRRKEGRILPWNFDEMVDKAKSNDKFMRRMTNKCSYLHGKDVLPKCSIIYQKYNTLNQINKLQINGEPISVALKQRIFDELI